MHLEKERTLYEVSQRVYWPGLKEDVERYVAACDHSRERSERHSQIAEVDGALLYQVNF